MLPVFVVMELVNIFLLNVTAIVVDVGTLSELSVGLTEETVGRFSDSSSDSVVNPLVV